MLLLTAFLAVGYFGSFKLQRQPSQNISIDNKKVILRLTCVATGKFCQSGYDVAKDKQYVGFGGKIESNRKIIAAFDGELTQTETSLPQEVGGESFQSLYLVSYDQKILARYMFKGAVTKKGRVVEGETIGKVGGIISYYDNNALIFSMARFDPADGTGQDHLPLIRKWLNIKVGDFKN